jgi:hypothetical protein
MCGLSSMLCSGHPVLPSIDFQRQRVQCGSVLAERRHQLAVRRGQFDRPSEQLPDKSDCRFAANVHPTVFALLRVGRHKSMVVQVV